MACYDVRVAASAVKDLEDLEKALVKRIWAAIEDLRNHPRSVATKKLKAAETSYRRRVGEYRMLYTIDDKEKRVTVMAIRHRREAYR